MRTSTAALAIVATSLLLSGCVRDDEKSALKPSEHTDVPGERIDEVLDVGDRVFFAYDSAIISTEGQSVLRRVADWLAKYPNVKISIEGHADERGTREYNLALGDRRAVAVKRALVAFGVGADRLATVSYGKERPAVVGSSEAVWSQNRRAVMVMN